MCYCLHHDLVNLYLISIERQTAQWPNNKGHRIDNDLQNNTQKAKDWAMRIPLNTGNELRWTVRVGTDTRRVTLGTHAMINHELRKHREVPKTRGAYLWPVVTQKLSKD
jgi:hypothetical protein